MILLKQPLSLVDTDILHFICTIFRRIVLIPSADISAICSAYISLNVLSYVENELW